MLVFLGIVHQPSPWSFHVCFCLTDGIPHVCINQVCSFCSILIHGHTLHCRGADSLLMTYSFFFDWGISLAVLHCSIQCTLMDLAFHCLGHTQQASLFCLFLHLFLDCFFFVVGASRCSQTRSLSLLVFFHMSLFIRTVLVFSSSHSLQVRPLPQSALIAAISFFVFALIAFFVLCCVGTRCNHADPFLLLALMHAGFLLCFNIDDSSSSASSQNSVPQWALQPSIVNTWQHSCFHQHLIHALSPLASFIVAECQSLAPGAIIVIVRCNLHLSLWEICLLVETHQFVRNHKHCAAVAGRCCCWIFLESSMVMTHPFFKTPTGAHLLLMEANSTSNNFVKNGCCVRGPGYSARSYPLPVTAFLRRNWFAAQSDVTPDGRRATC